MLKLHKTNDFVTGAVPFFVADTARDIVIGRRRVLWRTNATKVVRKRSIPCR